MTKADIARWMLQEIEKRGFLYQDEAADNIEAKFGSDWIYENENGNPAIHRGVLTEFRKIKPEHITWDKSEKCWS